MGCPSAQVGPAQRLIEWAVPGGPGSLGGRAWGLPGLEWSLCSPVGRVGTPGFRPGGL